MPDNEIFEVTKIINNLNQHNFTVQTYRMSKDEADLVIKVLKNYLLDLKNDSKLEY